MQEHEEQAVFREEEQGLTVIHGLEAEAEPGGVELPCLGPQLQDVVPVGRQRGHVTPGQPQASAQRLVRVPRDVDAAGNTNNVQEMGNKRLESSRAGNASSWNSSALKCTRCV